MKAIHWITAVAALAFGLPAPASAAVGDPEVIIYRFPGVLDDGGAANAGVATLFHCTNFSGVTETVRFVTRNKNAALLQNNTIFIVHLETRTAATHVTVAYTVDLVLATGAVTQGTTDCRNLD